jgi:hypothetical protein
MNMEQATALTYWPRCGHTAAAVCDACAVSVLDAVVAKHDYDMNDLRLAHDVTMSTLRGEHSRNMAALRQEHETWKNNLEVDAHEMATENNLCSVFDTFMEEHGMNPRSRDYVATVSVTVEVTVNCSGRDDQSAEESIDDYDVLSAVRETFSYGRGDIASYDVTAVTLGD